VCCGKVRDFGWDSGGLRVLVLCRVGWLGANRIACGATAGPGGRVDGPGAAARFADRRAMGFGGSKWRGGVQGRGGGACGIKRAGRFRRQPSVRTIRDGSRSGGWGRRRLVPCQVCRGLDRRVAACVKRRCADG